MAAIGAELVEIRFPDVAAVVELWVPFCAIETAFVHRETYPARKAEYGPTLSGFIDAGRSADPLTIARSNIERDRFKGELVRLFQKVDLVLMPRSGSVHQGSTS